MENNKGEVGEANDMKGVKERITEAWVWSCGICGGQSGAGAGFLQVLRFPLPIFIPPIAPQSPSSIYHLGSVQ
jgi:hypothetical protein